MKNFWLKMPLGKSLSHAFARATGRDLLCTRMTVSSRVSSVRAEFGSHSVGQMNIYTFVWLEARPVKGETGLYTIAHCSYVRNGWDAVSGDRHYHETTFRKKQPCDGYPEHFTRAEAIAFLMDAEKAGASSRWSQDNNVRLVPDQPSGLRALNVRRHAPVRV